MKQIKVNSLILGDGIPKICVSDTGRDKEEILEQAEKIKNSSAQVLEWRVDCLESAYTEKEILEILGELRQVTGDMPLLFTFRSREEGGKRELNDKDYLMLNHWALETGMIQILDVEYGRGNEILSELRDKCREMSTVFLISYHNFEKTPDKEFLVELSEKMKLSGADICKLAVMPENDRDVLRLLSVADIVGNQMDTPHISISMGEKGMISRVYAGRLGSVLTFASLDQASAPGQIDTAEMEKILQILYECQ